MSVSERTYFYHSLFLALLFCLSSCSLPEGKKQTELVWKNNKAVSLLISNHSVADQPSDSLPALIRIAIGNSANEPMLGEFSKRNGVVIFQPIVPFSRGMHYRVLFRGQVLDEFDIPVDSLSQKPVLSIYPSSDTLPENALKMYLQFSEPMVEGKSTKYIRLLNQMGDTLVGTFLDLQPELWNEGGNLLTLWFDPGRVKRDLIPNKLIGNPIISGQRYSLHISGTWKSKSGLPLDKTYIKSFFVKQRDEQVPGVDAWVLKVPAMGTQDGLSIRFQEPLDFSLVQSAIQLLDDDKKVVRGKIILIDEENGIDFIPVNVWRQGNYFVRVASKLEDLAGNNLIRPFDRDLTKTSTLSEQEYFEKRFTIP